MTTTIATLLKRKSIFFTGLLLLTIGGLIIGFLLPDIIFLSNAEKQKLFWLNIGLINYTFLGSAEFAFCLIGFLLFKLKRKEEAIILLLSSLITILLTQLIKNISIGNTIQLYFETGQYLFSQTDQAAENFYIISSHTAIAFAVATSLILLDVGTKMQILLLLAACLVGYSRIYLANHSVIAVSAGAFIGSLSSLLAYLATIKRHKKVHYTSEELALHKRRVMYN